MAVVAPGLGRLTRRLALARAGAGLAAGSVLAACARPASQAAPAPQPRAGATLVVFQANNQGVPWNATTLSLYQDFVDSTFNAQNPTLQATVFAGGSGNAAAQLVATAAGRGFADIYEGCCDDVATLESAGALLALDGYLRQDNLQTSLWSPGHIAGLTFNGQLFGLPSYDGPAVLAYRQDLLDDLGLQYPDPTWTYQDAASLWQSCTGTTSRGSKRRGVDVIFDEAATTWQFWLKGWGVEIMDAGHTTCTANTPAGAEALSYLANLHTTGVMQAGSGTGDLASGSVVFSMCGGWNVFDEATQLGTKFKWDLLPMPAWPQGKATFGNVDFYALNRASQNPDAAWEVLKWLTAQPDWQRFQMKATMVQPCLLSLWDEWQSIVTTVAPPMKGKALHWYQDAALGYAYATLHFSYAPAQANAIADQWLDAVWNGQVGAQAGLGQIATQINALETVARAEAGLGAAAAKAFPTSGPALAAAAPGS